jgi:enoyl-CoA hydratase/carnithine racemase
MTATRFGDISVAIEGHVALVEIHRPPHNFFDDGLIAKLADVFEALDKDDQCRALVLASEGRSFCAGADFSRASEPEGDELQSGRAQILYTHAVRLFACRKPVVAAIQGAAVGGGLGLALVADFRVVAPEARFAANFVKLGIHPGFGLSHTLPRLIGVQRAGLMFYTGVGSRRRTQSRGDWPTCSRPRIGLRAHARELAAEMAACAPLAVQSTRATLRRALPEAVRRCDRA